MAKEQEVAARHYDVVLAPHITEKSTLASEHNAVVFKVANDATKPQIKEAVEAIFGVSVTGVNTINVKGKTKRWKGKAYKRNDLKKAVVTLKDGKTKALKGHFDKAGFAGKVLVIDGESVNDGFKKAAGNLPGVNVLPAMGANVYDILKHDTLVLTKDAVEKLEGRFNG